MSLLRIVPADYALLAAGPHRMVHLLELHLSGGTQYLTDAPWDIVYGGHTYGAAGQFLDMGNIDEQVSPIQSDVTFSLSGVDQVYTSMLLNQKYLNRQCKVYRVLLSEDGGQNQLLYADQFDNAAWNKYHAAVSANAIANPLVDGVTADKLIEDNTNNQHYLHQSASFTAGVKYSLSCFAKKLTRDHVNMYFSNTAFAPQPTVVFDLTNGTVVSQANAVSVAITPIRDGWFRLVLVDACTTTIAANVFIVLHNGVSNTYLGDGASGLYLWGGQLEPLSAASSPKLTADVAYPRQSTPLEIFDGYIAKPTLQEDPDGRTSVISLVASGRWALMARTNGRMCSDSIQQFWFPGDTGMKDANKVLSPIPWGKGVTYFN